MSSQARFSVMTRTWKGKIGLLALAAGGIMAVAALVIPTVLQAATGEPSPSALSRPAGPRAPAAPAAGSAIVSWEHDQIRPEAAYGSSAGQYLVVWEDHHWGCGEDWDIYGQLVNDDGTLAGAKFGIAWEDENARLAPDVAYNSTDDEFLVVWEHEHSATDHDIRARRVDADGSLLGPEMSLAYSNEYDSNPSVAYNSFSNEYLVVWEYLAGSDEFTHKDVYGIRVQADGTTGTGIGIAATYREEAFPAVAYGQANGEYLVVWQEQRGGTDGYDIRGQRVTGAGSLAGSQIGIETWDDDQIQPRLAYGSVDNHFLVVWEDHYWGASNGSDIYGQLIEASGSLDGSHILIAGDGSKDREVPDVDYKPVGRNYLVVWEHAHSASDHDVHSRRVAYDGTTPDDEATVTASGSYEGRPIAASGSGWAFLSAWEDDRNLATMGRDVYGMILTMEVPTLSGRVYRGTVGTETSPLSGVSVGLYCSQSTSLTGTLVTNATTDSQGWYGLPAYGECEVYNIQETDPEETISAGSTTVGGVIVTSNWIQYAHPLSGKTLTGNKFWDYPAGPGDPLPPGNWANFSPSGWSNSQALDSTVQVEDTVSGLEVGTAEYAFSTDGGSTWSSWEAASCTGTSGTTSPQTITAPDVPYGQDSGAAGQNRIKFRISDREGQLGESGAYSVKIDSVPPQNPSSLSSYTHTPSTWSTTTQIAAQWSGASDVSSGLAGYSTVWDYLTLTVPDAAVDTTGTSITSYTLDDRDDWYLHVRAIDHAGNGASGAVHLGPFYIDTEAPYSNASSSSSVTSSSFTVSWSGTDNVSGIASYDVQYRDMLLGTAWTSWKSQTTATSATFSGQHGHTYQFRCRAKDNGGNQEAWPSSYDTSTAVATLDFEATGLEVTQAIQDLNNSVLLVSGKRTYVRLHVRSNAQGDQGPVKARLTGWDGFVNLGSIKPNNPGGTITVRQTPNRSQLGHTFYFDLPSSWLYGSLTLDAEVNPDDAWAESNTTNNSIHDMVTFQSTPDMDLLIVDVCYTFGGNTVRIRNTDRQLLASWLKRAYPISTLNVWHGTFSPCYGSLPSAGDVNKALAWNKSRKVLGSNEDPYTRYYGMAMNTGGFMRGQGQRPGTIASGPTGSSTSGWDTDGSFGDWYGAHELGHNYDQRHTRGVNPPTCGGGNCSSSACGPWGVCGCEAGAVVHYSNGDISPTQDASRSDALYGFDVGTLTIYPPSWNDVMTYCDNLWISDYTYESIRNRMVSESGSPRLMRPAQLEEHLAVFGTIYTDTGQVELDTMYRVPEAWDMFGRTPGEYSIRLLDGETVLEDYPFTPHLNHVDPGPDCETGAEQEAEPGLIIEYVPWVEGTTRIAITHGAEELASRQVSGNAPEVSLLEPNDGVLDTEEITVVWQANDADGDDLEFTLEYSVDGGEEWSPLGSGITGTQIVLDADFVPGTDRGKFRILASDGVNTAQDESDGTFSVASKPPHVEIESPADGAVYLTGQSVALSAFVIDLEDGSLGEDGLSWTSSLSGTIGTGELLHVTDLAVGTHDITVTASGGDGQPASDTVTIHVTSGDAGLGVGYYLPIMLRSD